MLQKLKLAEEVDGSVWRYANLASANRQHRHLELELNVITRGEGTYLLGSRRYPIHRGHLLWLFPAQEHVLIEQSPDFEMWIAVFKRRAVRRLATDASARPLLASALAADACRRLQPPDLAKLQDVLTELSTPDVPPGLLNAGLAYTLLLGWSCFQRATEVVRHDVHPAVERAARLIRDQASGANLKELAHTAGLSPSRLSRLFKQQTGSTLVEFRNRQRIERFWQLYRDGRSRTLLDAALDAGFGSYPQFHRVFKAVVGRSPREYRSR